MAKARLKAPLVATVSARALIIRLPTLASLAQNGTSPQCLVVTRRAAPSWSTTYTSLVGATFQFDSRACSGTSAAEK